MGAAALVLSWTWLWDDYFRIQFGTLGWLFWRILGFNVPIPN